MKNQISSLINKYWHLWRRKVEETRFELPFFWFLTFVLLCVLTGILFYTPLASSFIMVMVSFVIVIQILLYWVSLIFDFRRVREFALYLGIQLFLIYTVLLMTHSIYVATGLFMTLIGHISGFPIPGRRKMITVTFLVFLLFFYIWSIQPSFLAHPLLTIVGFSFAIIFQFIFTSVYNRTAEAKYEAQEALEKLEIANIKIEQMTRSEERQRIARELHDTLAQGLTGIILQLDAVDLFLEKGDPAKAQAIIQRSMQAARATLAQSRGVIDDLRRTQNPDNLAHRLDEIAINSITKIQLMCTLPDDLAQNESTLIETMLGEAVMNINKHAQATKALISISYSPSEIQIQVKDDGMGFNPHDLQQRSGHYGLLGMQERVQSVGGSLQIYSRPASGCTLDINFPRISEVRHE